jgi:two-component system NtrC family sensor kinase
MLTVALRPSRALEAESSLLGLLLTADTARAGAAGVLAVLMSGEDDLSSAIAVRDRDSVSLRVLAEQGAPRDWPSMIDAPLAFRGEPGVDRATGFMVVPLRAEGRFLGAVLLDPAQRAVPLVQDESFRSAVDTAAGVLHALLERMESELRHQLAARYSIDSVVDGMAHQMANPLTGASAIAEVLIEELGDSEHVESVRGISSELGRAFTVLGDLLDFHRDTHAQDGFLDLLAMVQRVLRFRGYAIREAGIDLKLVPPDQVLTVHADPRLEHALLVGLQWAELRSRGRVNRRIDVRIVANGEAEATVQITDSGPGDVPEITAGYFDMPLLAGNVSAAHADRQPPDLGLVDRMLRACGGRLAVSGSETDGTTISLVIPTAHVAAAKVRRTHEAVT